MSYIALEPKRIPLPATKACLTFSVEAKSLGRWREVQQDAALALQHFHQVTKQDGAVWFASNPWTDRARTATNLVTMYLSTDAAITKDQLKEFGAPIERRGTWSADGVHERPDEAFPSLATHRGTVHQVWLDTGAEKVAVELSMTGKRQIRYLSKSEPEDFLAFVKHAQGAKRLPDPAAHFRKRQLKLAFALDVGRRIVEADGIIDETEKDYLRRTFPDSVLEELDLSDPDEQYRMYDEAAAELGTLLGHHEKLALLSTFFATCYSDGKLDVREIKVLKEASGVLGIENTDVVSYLQKLW